MIFFLLALQAQASTFNPQSGAYTLTENRYNEIQGACHWIYEIEGDTLKLEIRDNATFFTRFCDIPYSDRKATLFRVMDQKQPDKVIFQDLSGSGRNLIVFDDPTTISYTRLNDNTYRNKYRLTGFVNCMAISPDPYIECIGPWMKNNKN